MAKVKKPKYKYVIVEHRLGSTLTAFIGVLTNILTLHYIKMNPRKEVKKLDMLGEGQ